MHFASLKIALAFVAVALAKLSWSESAVHFSDRTKAHMKNSNVVVIKGLRKGA
jgi:hypothetical protein